MKAFEGYTYLDGGICAAKGFQASGTYCGIKKAMAPDSNEGEIGKEKNDNALVVADTLCNTAAVYTQNVQADRRCIGHCTGRSDGYVHRCHRADFTVRAD